MTGAGRADSADRWIPFVFVIFFAVIIAVNGVLVYFAFDSWVGLTETDAYRKGIAYNRTLERVDQQRALGWDAALSVKLVDAGRSRVVVDLRGRDGVALPRARVTLRFVRPTHAGYDFDFVLVAAGGGRYMGDVALPLSGQWDINIRAELRGRIAEWRRRVEVP